MPESISLIWAGLRDAGMPDVMLFMPDGTASRCHWDETAMIGPMRVALLGDQERKIVRVVPVDSCIGIGVATPKGIDTSCYRGMVQTKLADRTIRPSTRPHPATAPNLAASPTTLAGVATPLPVRTGSGILPSGSART
jgi:hypothetical protein